MNRSFRWGQVLRAATLACLLGASFSGPRAAGICEGISPASDTPLTTIRVTGGLTKPLFVTSPPGDTHRIFVIEQAGRIRIVKDNALLATSFLDVASITQSTGDEEGLLGLAFSPGYATDGYFFIYHTDTGGVTNSIARYQVSLADPDLANPASGVVVLTIAHPTNSNHNGGSLNFGPADGFLYVGTGDGGGSCDVPNNAQNTNELKGKILRLDVIPAPVPPDPPYRTTGNPGFPKAEIWAYGLRNPWRFSFDRTTHDLYIGDVGQNRWEEIDYRPASSTGGENYGWRNYEGLECPPVTGFPSSCPAICTPIATRVDPVKVYGSASNNGGGSNCSAVGGYVYRGCRMPSLASQNRYFYADYCAATVSSFVLLGGAVTNELTHTTALAPGGGIAIGLITSFGEDARGEIYLTDRGSGAGSGEVYKIVPALSNLEVSGSNATPFLLGANWTWEDMALNSSYPIAFYRVYRNSGNGSGIFDCVYKTPLAIPPLRPATIWPGGDPSVPAAGHGYNYVVTAVRTSAPAGESSPGKTSSGVPRAVSAAVCP